MLSIRFKVKYSRGKVGKAWYKTLIIDRPDLKIADHFIFDYINLELRKMVFALREIDFELREMHLELHEMHLELHEVNLELCEVKSVRWTSQPSYKRLVWFSKMYFIHFTFCTIHINKIYTMSFIKIYIKRYWAIL